MGHAGDTPARQMQLERFERICVHCFTNLFSAHGASLTEWQDELNPTMADPEQELTRRRSRWVLMGIVVVGLVALGITLIADREPEYQGKPLSYWLEKLPLDPPHDPPGIEAQLAVRAIGTNALPYLLRAITSQDSQVRKDLISLDDRISMIDLHLEPASKKVDQAVAGFIALGEIAEPAVPELVALVHNEETFVIAGTLLPYLGRAGFDATVAMLRDTNAALRSVAALQLGWPIPVGTSSSASSDFAYRYRQRASVAIPRLIDLLRDSDSGVVSAAVKTLGVLRIQRNDVIPALTNLAADTTAPVSVRVQAVRSLARFGSDALPTVPLIETFTNADDVEFKRVSVSALEWIHRESRGDSQRNRDE